MDATVVSFLSGVGLAIAGLSINEAVSFQIKAYRLRKLIAIDAESTVAGQVENAKTFGAVEEGLTTDKSASFLWEGAGGPPAFLTDIPVYLTTAESALALKYYAAQNRIDEIRLAFNDAVKGLLTDANKKDVYEAIAIACLHDLKKNYEESRSSGTALAALVRKNFWAEGEEV